MASEHMPQFSYRARRRFRRSRDGLLDVSDRSAALTQIERLGLFPVMVEIAKSSGAARVEAALERGPSRTLMMPPALREFLHRKRKPKLQELATFTQQLANLLIGHAVNGRAQQHDSPGVQGISPEVSKQLKQDVMEGKRAFRTR